MYIDLMRALPLLLACSLVACSKASQSPTPGGAPSPSVSSNSGNNNGNSVPSTFVRTTAELPALRTIDVRDGLTHPQAMRALVDALSQRYVVDVVDPRAGFAMTTWQASAIRDGVPDLRYRTRITARYIGDDWKSLRVISEARWARGQEADIGYDSAQLDSIAADLRGKIGKKP
jgi:hypothetical protein